MSWNSTHTAMVIMGAVVIAGMHFQIDMLSLAPILTPLGAYIALREKARVKNNTSG